MRFTFGTHRLRTFDGNAMSLDCQMILLDALITCWLDFDYPRIQRKHYELACNAGIVWW